MKRPLFHRLGVVLAAGGSRRMGTCKALLSFRDAPIVVGHCDALRPWCDRLRVVVGAEADRVARSLPSDAEVVRNPAWQDTRPLESLALALADVDVAEAIVVPVDTLPAHAATLRTLTRLGAPAVPVDADGRRGHPVLLDAAVLARVREGDVPGGLRTLLEHARTVVVDDATVSLDFDTPEAWHDRPRRG